MNKFIRLYNQNRKKIWIIVIVVIGGYLLIKTVNNSIKNENEVNKIGTSNAARTIINPNKSSISDYEVNESMYKSQSEIVSDFVESCNNKEITSAYELLSDECKEELYPTIKDFKEYYYDNIFYTKRTYSLQNWTDSIYKIRYTEDIMTTGKITDSSSFQDYIKIITNDKNKKISISGFLGKELINKEKEYKKIKVKVISKKIYMNYEIYDLEIENKNDQIIMLDTLTNNKTMYLIDKNKTKHYALSNEIVKDTLRVESKHVSKISIKFDNPYIKNRTITSIEFSNVLIGFGAAENEIFSIDL